MFCTKEDLIDNAYEGILDTLADNSDSFLLTNIAKGIEEVESGINQKYQTEEMWKKTGDERNILILSLVCDIAVYHAYKRAEEIPVSVREAYDYARDTIKDIRNGNISLRSVALISDAEQDPDQPSNDEIVGGGISNRY